MNGSAPSRQLFWIAIVAERRRTAEKRPSCPAVELPRWKRTMDVGLAGSVLVVGSPVIGMIAVLNRLLLGPGVIYRSRRGGHGGAEFELLKFRTMTDACDVDGQLLSDVERTPAWGRILRASSLDELPGLVNVLRGEMSVVGPRPLIARYLDRYTDEQALRHRLRPGLTGLAQVSGRNLVEWEDRFALDNHYIDSLTLRLDMQILARTIVEVVRRTGADGNDHTVEFMGTCEDVCSATILDS